MCRFFGDDYVATDYRRLPECGGPPVRDQYCKNGHLCQIDIGAVGKLFNLPLVIFCRECGVKVFEVVIFDRKKVEVEEHGEKKAAA